LVDGVRRGNRNCCSLQCLLHGLKHQLPLNGESDELTSKSITYGRWKVGNSTFPWVQYPCQASGLVSTGFWPAPSQGW
jgi:hypothetical protein